MRISDWSPDVCSSDLDHLEIAFGQCDYDQSACDAYLLCDTVAQGRQVRNSGPPVLRNGPWRNAIEHIVFHAGSDGETVSGNRAIAGNEPQARENDSQPAAKLSSRARGFRKQPSAIKLPPRHQID